MIYLPRLGPPVNLKYMDKISPEYRHQEAEVGNLSVETLSTIRRRIKLYMCYNQVRIPYGVRATCLSSDKILIEFMRDDLYGYLVLTTDSRFQEEVNVKRSKHRPARMTPITMPKVTQADLYVAPLPGFEADFTEAEKRICGEHAVHDWPFFSASPSSQAALLDLYQLCMLLDILKTDRMLTEVLQNIGLSPTYTLSRVESGCYKHMKITCVKTTLRFPNNSYFYTLVEARHCRSVSVTDPVTRRTESGNLRENYDRYRLSSSKSLEKLLTKLITRHVL